MFFNLINFSLALCTRFGTNFYSWATQLELCQSPSRSYASPIIYGAPNNKLGWLAFKLNYS